ncbi:hypothetical protein EV175_000490 [Coemansia sp. RSA 1933]|nr:hypothetical protein EV175_000490 [Coemansia sp. RSA 1933]
MSDDTVQQVYMRITQKIQECQKQLSQIDVQISTHQREGRLASLTKREIEGLDESVPMYRLMGKMFIQESKDELLKDINKTTNDGNTLVEALEKKKRFVQRDLDEATGNLKDMLKSVQKTTAK